MHYLCDIGGALFDCHVDQSEVLCHIAVGHRLCDPSNRRSIGAAQSLQKEVENMQNKDDLPTS